jgi:hypothetical protein
MSTGKYVNFHRSDTGDRFNITLDSAGHLEFRANAEGPDGNRRMSILDDTNEVSFDGSITVVDTATIGGSGYNGGLQLRSADEDNTIFLGSTDTEAHALLGTHGRSGRVQLKNGDGKINVDLFADSNVAEGGGQLNVNVDGVPTIVLNGTFATVTVGSSLLNGTINVQDATGTNRIILDAATGDIKCDTINGKPAP